MFYRDGGPTDVGLVVWADTSGGDEWTVHVLWPDLTEDMHTVGQLGYAVPETDRPW